MLKESEPKLQPNDENVTPDLITGQKSSPEKGFSLPNESVEQHIIPLKEHQSANIDSAVWQFGEECPSTSKKICRSVQARPHFRSKEVMCKPVFHSVSCEAKPNTKDTACSPIQS